MTLQQSIVARDAAEASMTTLFLELKRVVDEITGFAGKDKEAADYKVSASEKQRFQLAADQEEAVKRDKLIGNISRSSKRGITVGDTAVVKGGRRASSASTAASDKGATGSSCASNVIWTKVKEQISLLEGQWSHARRSCKQAVLKATIHVSERSPSYLACRRSQTATSDASCKAKYSPHKRFGEGPRAAIEKNDETTIPQNSALLHQVFGLSVPSAWKAASDQDNCFGKETDNSTVAFDMKRISSLQQDLITFAELISGNAALRAINAGVSIPPTPPTVRATETLDVLWVDGSYNAQPKTAEAASAQENNLRLMLVAQELTIHLAALSPLVPPSIDLNSPVSSRMTGLELLRAEVRCRSCSF
jgi:hypothetical protein